MKTVWTDQVENKEDFAKKVLSSIVVLDRLIEILSRIEAEKTKTKEENYDNPNWPYLRADRDGYIRCLQDIKALCTINRDKRKD